MIRVYYWPRDLRLVIEGHAPKKWQDGPAVCAAASALYNSLCDTTNGFLKRGWCKRRFYLETDDGGLGYCRIWARRRYFKRCRVAMGMCFGGLWMLADKHPNLVHVEVCTGIPIDDFQVIKENAEGGVHFLKKFCYDMRKDRPYSTGRKAKTDEK